MKRKELVIFGIFLFLILFACNKEIEHAPPDINSESGDYFDVISAQAYFETHATDLSPIRFSDTISTRSGGIELIPEWKRAIVSSNKNVDIVEVPIWSNSMYISVENIVENGQLAFQKFHRSQRRLIIARPKTGDVVMFVATLHPSATAGGNPDKNMESFRYLSGEDFVGLVFCSTLDGKYMEAWNYTGERIVPITVKTRREWLKHGDDLSNASYQAIQFSETIMTRTTYTGEEKKCEYHGTFSCECLDEAIVRTCSKCKSSLEPEKTCDCGLCIKCGKYIQSGTKCITCCCQDCGKFLLSGKNCDCKNICKDCEKQKPCPCDPNVCPKCSSKSCSCRLCHSATCWGKCSSGGNTGGGYIPPPIDPVVPPGGNVTPPGENTNPPGYDGEEKPSEGKATAQKIQTITKEAVVIMLNQHGLEKAVCNFGVQYVFNQLYSTKELNNKRANDMVEYWENTPSRWEPITMSEAQKLANEGWFVVAGWKAAPGKSGHVVVVVPGEEVAGWGVKVPVCMDTGSDKKNPKQGLNYSFGIKKKNDIKFFKYK